VTTLAKIAYVGNVPEALDGGRPLAPGDHVDGVDIDLPHNAWLVEEGLAIVLEEAPPPKLTGKALHKRAAELGIPDRSNLRADELRDAIAAREAELQEQETEETTGGDTAAETQTQEAQQ
jgi:hypothetical protein